MGRVEARRVGVEEQHRRIFGDGEEAVAECPKQVGSSQTGAIAGAYSHHHDRKEQPRGKPDGVQDCQDSNRQIT